MPTIEELDAKIAAVKQQIAERNAMIVPQPKTRVGWASYIIDNDRGLLDKYADAERAWYQMKLQQEQQDKLQKEQHKFAKELAREQRNQQDLIHMDENMKARANAAVKYNYALQNLDRANKSGIKADIDRAELELALSRHELDYYNKRTGYTEPLQEVVIEDVPATNDIANVDVLMGDIGKLSSTNSLQEMESMLKKAEEHPEYKSEQNSKLRDKVTDLKKLISNKKAYLKDEEFRKNWKPGQPFDAKKFRRVINKGVWSLERKK